MSTRQQVGEAQPDRRDVMAAAGAIVLPKTGFVYEAIFDLRETKDHCV